MRLNYYKNKERLEPEVIGATVLCGLVEDKDRLDELGVEDVRGKELRVLNVGVLDNWRVACCSSDRRVLAKRSFTLTLRTVARRAQRSWICIIPYRGSGR